MLRLTLYLVGFVHGFLKMKLQPEPRLVKKWGTVALYCTLSYSLGHQMKSFAWLCKNP